MNPSDRRRPRQSHPLAERCEGRLLLSATPAQAEIASILRAAPAAASVRPNTPVLPFGAAANVASFIDPTVRITYGQHIAIGRQDFIAPYATLDAGPPGFIKIGSGSTIQDDAIIMGNPGQLPGGGVLIGNSVVIGPGATVRGPGAIGGFGAAAKPTSIGPNALIDGGSVAPGAIVSALARVGPGVTIPGGFRVLPGANVTTQEEARIPALGKVVAVTAADLAAVSQTLANNVALAAGYTTLYQGNAATGASPGVDPSVTGVNNGNLAAVTGANREPGPGTAAAPLVRFEPGSFAPQFPGRLGAEVEAVLPQFRARVTGPAIFIARAGRVAHRLGRGNSIRADEGQPIAIGSIVQSGTDVSIHAPLTNATATATSAGVFIGRNLVIADGARILGGPGGTTALGDDVTVGAGAVIDRSTIGNGATIGARAYVANSTLPPGAAVPDGTLLINNKVQGTIQY